MKRLFLLFFVLFFAHIAQAQFNTIWWQKEQLTIDGVSSDWGTVFRYFDPKTKIRYNLSNDSNYLYLCFQPVDDYLQAQIIRSGMQIFFSHSIKPKRKASLKYPFPLDESTRENDINVDDSFEAYFKSFQLFNNKFVSEGFDSANGNLPIYNETGIQVNFDQEPNKLVCYELRIPLKEIYGADYDLQKIAQKDLTVKLKINSLTMRVKEKSGIEKAENYVDREQYERNYASQYYRQSHYNSMTTSGNTYTISDKMLKHKLRIVTKAQ